MFKGQLRLQPVAWQGRSPFGGMFQGVAPKVDAFSTINRLLSSALPVLWAWVLKPTRIILHNVYRGLGWYLRVKLQNWVSYLYEDCIKLVKFDRYFQIIVTSSPQSYQVFIFQQGIAPNPRLIQELSTHMYGFYYVGEETSRNRHVTRGRG